MATTWQYVFTYLLNSLHLMLCLAIIIYSIRFRKYCHVQAIQKRHPWLVHLMGLFSILFIFQNIFYKLSFVYGVTSFDRNALKQKIKDDEYYGTVFLLISTMCYIFSLHGLGSVLIARSWIIYFEINRNIQIQVNIIYPLQYAYSHCTKTQKSKWSVHLDANSSSFWFIKNNQRFASNKCIYLFVICWTLCIGVLLMILILSNSGVDDFISSSFVVIEFVILCVLWCKVPPFYDAFLIKQEMAYVLGLALTATIFLILWALKVAIFGYHFYVFMIFQFVTGSIVGAMAIIINVFLFSSNNEHFLMDIQCSPKNEQLSNKDNSFHKIYTLKQTLANEGLIEGFFQHLSNEFSVELLLAFIELTQFRALMKKDTEFMTKIESEIQQNVVSNKLKRAPMHLSHTLPQSKIVHEMYDNVQCNEDKYLLIAHDLFVKYIGYRSAPELEINISAPCRAHIASFMSTHCNEEKSDGQTLSSKEMYALFMLFEEARGTLYRLMASSHRRFLKANNNTIKRVSVITLNKLMTPTTPVIGKPNLSFSLIDVPSASVS